MVTRPLTGMVLHMTGTGRDGLADGGMGGMSSKVAGMGGHGFGGDGDGQR